MTAGRLLRVGLTGGIASGKSTVSEMLRQLGAVVIDTDKIAREVVEPGSVVLESLHSRYGDIIMNADGSLRRDRLAEIVFSSPAEKSWLEQLLHPLIKQQAEQLALVAAEQGAKAVVFDVPLLFESGWDKMMDVIWIVYVPAELQHKRLKLRDGFSDAAASSRLAAQWPIDEKAKWADLVINNAGTPVETRSQVEAAWQSIGLSHQ